MRMCATLKIHYIVVLIHKSQKNIAQTLPIQGLVSKIRTQFACQTRCHNSQQNLLEALDFRFCQIEHKGLHILLSQISQNRLRYSRRPFVLKALLAKKITLV